MLYYFRFISITKKYFNSFSFNNNNNTGNRFINLYRNNVYRNSFPNESPQTLRVAFEYAEIPVLNYINNKKIKYIV